MYTSPSLQFLDSYYRTFQSEEGALKEASHPSDLLPAESEQTSSKSEETSSGSEQTSNELEQLATESEQSTGGLDFRNEIEYLSGLSPAELQKAKSEGEKLAFEIMQMMNQETHLAELSNAYDSILPRATNSHKVRRMDRSTSA